MHNRPTRAQHQNARGDMTTQIKLTIASDGERCGECHLQHEWFPACVAYEESLTVALQGTKDAYHIRCQACLDAEVRPRIHIPEQTEEDKANRVLRGVTVTVDEDPMIHMRMSELAVHIDAACEAVVQRHLDAEMR